MATLLIVVIVMSSSVVYSDSELGVKMILQGVGDLSRIRNIRTCNLVSARYL
jgi:hypothetical protein